MILKLLLALTILGTCWAIEIYVDGLSNANRKRFCVGERVMLRCRRPSSTNTFTWSVSSLLSQSRGVIRVNSGQRNVGIFQLNAIRDLHESVSTLYFDVSESLVSGSPSTILASCYGGGTEESTSISLGNVSPPKFSVHQTRNYSSFKIKLKNNSACADKYRVHLTDNTGRYNEGFISSTEDFMSGKDIMDVVSSREPLNLCKNTYNLVIDAVKNGLTQTTSMSPIKIDYSEIGKLSNFNINDNAIHWSVPDTLKDCITDYQYTFRNPNDASQTSDNHVLQMQNDNGVTYYNSQDNRIKLSQLPENYCERIIVISPRVASSSEPLYNSRLEGSICEHRYYHLVTEPQKSTFARQLTLGLVFGITGLILFFIIVCCMCMIGCHLHKSKRNRPQPQVTAVDHHQNHAPPGYADATRNKDNIVPTPSYPQPSVNPAYPQPIPLETPYQPPPQYSSEIFNT